MTRTSVTQGTSLCPRYHLYPDVTANPSSSPSPEFLKSIHILVSRCLLAAYLCICSSLSCVNAYLELRLNVGPPSKTTIISVGKQPLNLFSTLILKISRRVTHHTEVGSSSATGSMETGIKHLARSALAREEPLASRV